MAKLHKPIDGNPEEWLERKWGWDARWTEFICGSCKGLYRVGDREFEILAVHNSKRNGDFDRVLNWFDKSCLREKYNLSFLEIGNPKLRDKLSRLGFVGDENKMTKVFRKSLII